MRLLRGLGSHLLPCGCLTGVYETYDAAIVTIVDVPGPQCPVLHHRRHAVIDGPAAAPADRTAPAPDASGTSRS